MSFDFDAWTELGEKLWQQYAPIIASSSTSVAMALIILIVGIWFARKAGKTTRALLLKNPRLNSTIASFAASAVRYGITVVVALAVLHRFGVETTSIVAVLGAASLAVGLALQGTLSNVAAGFMLVLFRPYKLGDVVEIAGMRGTVEDITLFTTEISTLEIVQVIIPNAKVWGEPISNFSAKPIRRLDLTFGVSYSDDLRKVQRVLEEILDADPRIHKTPPPMVKVRSLSDWSVDFVVRAFVNNAEIVDVGFDLNFAVKEAFDREGIEIPFPTQTEFIRDMAQTRVGS